MKLTALFCCMFLLLMLPQCTPSESNEAATTSPSVQAPPDAESDRQIDPPQPTEMVPERTERPGLLDRGYPDMIATVEVKSAVLGEVPEELLTAILEDLIARTAAQPEAITTVRAEEAIWGDGGMGCAAPGDEYTQEPVQGYWVVLRLAEREYDYRADATGRFFLCDLPWPAASGAPTG